MDAENQAKDPNTCMAECEKAFIDHTVRTYTGGVEELRRCRNKCSET